MSENGEYVEVPKGQYMQTIESRLRESITALGPSSPTEKEDLDATVKLINDSMTTPGRVYHAMQHVFDISKEMRDPILVLSALFHDVIYYSIDQSFSKEQAEALEGVLLPEMQGLTLATSFDDPLQEMVVKLYGFEPGAPLPKSGTNEFLSNCPDFDCWLDVSLQMCLSFLCANNSMVSVSISLRKGSIHAVNWHVELYCPVFE
jgi:hypothetical protein